MSLVSLLIILLAVVVVVSVIVWLVQKANYPGPAPQIIIWIVCGIAIIALIVLLLAITGVDLNIGGPLPRVR